MKRLLPILLVTAQAALLAVELFTRYDTIERQLALALTNVVAVGFFLRVRSWLGRKGIDFPWAVLALVSAAVWLDALGNFQHLYARFWWWDRLTHAVGLLPVTLGFVVVLELLAARGRIRLPFWARAVFALTLANTLGALYEVSEWLGDLAFSTQRVTGLYDAPRDLLNNLLGGVVVLLGVVVYRRLTGSRRAATMAPRAAQDLRQGQE